MLKIRLKEPQTFAVTFAIKIKLVLLLLYQ